MDILILLVYALAIYLIIDFFKLKMATKARPATASRAKKKPTKGQALVDDMERLLKAYSWKHQLGDLAEINPVSVDPHALIALRTAYELGNTRGHLITQIMKNPEAYVRSNVRVCAVYRATLETTNASVDHIVFAIDLDSSFQAAYPHLFLHLKNAVNI